MPFGEPLIRVATCVSTQLLLDAAMPEGAAALADEQTAGRGRLGRHWEAPPGTALLCSILLKPPAGRRIQELSLVAGVAVAGTIGPAAGIKWPNDVLLGEGKVAGILAEARDGAVVLGIGVNVRQSPDQLPEGAAALGAGRDRDDLFAALLEQLERRYREWLAAGLTPLLPELSARDVLRGREVSVDGRRGVAAGIDDAGRLLLDLDGRPTPVESGEVLYGTRLSGTST